MRDMIIQNNIFFIAMLLCSLALTVVFSLKHKKEDRGKLSYIINSSVKAVAIVFLITGIIYFINLQLGIL